MQDFWITVRRLPAGASWNSCEYFIKFHQVGLLCTLPEKASVFSADTFSASAVTINWFSEVLSVCAISLA